MAAPIFWKHPYPLSFITVSGSHLYGFESSDSDIDLRGVHVVPANEALGIRGIHRSNETVKRVDTENGRDDELVTHDAGKYFRLLLKNNGYVLEQIYSPLLVLSDGHLGELRAIAKTCITSNHHLHYKGFGYGEWTRFINNPTKHVKRILYIFRVFMTGIFLMQTGEVQSNILALNEVFNFPFIPELVEQKRRGYEKDELAAGRSMEFYTREYHKLEERLIEAAAQSHLPKEPAGYNALNDLLIRLRRENP